MLPFVFIDASKLGPFSPFGLCMMVAFFAGNALTAWRAKKVGLDEKLFSEFLIACLAGGFYGGHWIDMIFYHPDELLAHPWKLLFFWYGLSSTGAFVGALGAAALWKYYDFTRTGVRVRVTRRESPIALLPYADVNMAVGAIPFSIGRLGCALVHDHPGKFTWPGHPLALQWPLDENDGVHHVFGPLHVVTGGSTTRFDLGLIECLALAVIAVVMASLGKKRFRPGVLTAVACGLYGTARFFFDTLRIQEGPDAELRYLGLTFAQYWSVAVVALGVYLALRARRLAAAEASAGPRPPRAEPEG